jgi:uncharacterized membrane protein YbaN (DUF454 family)
MKPDPLPSADRATAGPPRIHDSHLVRVFFVAAGFLALILAVLGVVLPVLPSTPFVLLAAACFARSSERFHNWLLSHRVAGPVIREWQEHRAMPPGAKRWAYLLMGISFGISIYVVPSLWHRLMLGGIAIALGIFLWRVPVRPAAKN